MHQIKVPLLFLAMATQLSAATIVVVPAPPVSASAIVDNITGADMAGLIVRATYATPGVPTVVNMVWSATGLTSGDANNGGTVSVSLAGNTSSSLAWQYRSVFLSPLTSLEFDGTAAGVYFDRANPNPGTAGSGPGSDIEFGTLIPAGIDASFTVTYSNAVSLGINAAQNDLYARMRIDFGTGLIPQDFSFTQDTDRSVPEPSAALLVLTCVTLCWAARRK